MLYIYRGVYSIYIFIKSESQSIDIDSINLNKHVPNDETSKSLLPIEINQISVSRSHDGIIQNHDQPLSVPLAQQDIMDDIVPNFNPCF
jgi:hypothetical protein